MNSWVFSDDYDSLDFQVIPSFSQNILSENFPVDLPMLADYKEDEENDLFLSSTDACDQMEDIMEQEEEPIEEDKLVDDSLSSGSNFQIEEEVSTVITSTKKSKGLKKTKKSKNPNSRKKDQNMCKKYNVVAQNVVGKKLKLTQIVEQYKKIKHRQDFFLVMVINAKKFGKLEAFKKFYRSEIEKVKNSCSHLMKQTFKESPQFKKHQALLNAIDKSFECIKLYEEGRVEEAIYILFDLENLRNKKFIEKSIEFVCAIHRATQTP